MYYGTAISQTNFQSITRKKIKFTRGGWIILSILEQVSLEISQHHLHLQINTKIKFLSSNCYSTKDIAQESELHISLMLTRKTKSLNRNWNTTINCQQSKSPTLKKISAFKHQSNPILNYFSRSRITKSNPANQDYWPSQQELIRKIKITTNSLNPQKPISKIINPQVMISHSQFPCIIKKKNQIPQKSSLWNEP